jgi:hypothetical protein
VNTVCHPPRTDHCYSDFIHIKFRILKTNMRTPFDILFD